jgi:hypothetical protein
LRTFMTRWFARFAQKEQITEEQLCDAVERAEQGSVDADLGGGVIKQRIARKRAVRWLPQSDRLSQGAANRLHLRLRQESA